MGSKWHKAHPTRSQFLKTAWRKRHPDYMKDYKRLLNLFTAGKIKLKIGERLMDYQWMLK